MVLLEPNTPHPHTATNSVVTPRGRGQSPQTALLGAYLSLPRNPRRLAIPTGYSALYTIGTSIPIAAPYRQTPADPLAPPYGICRTPSWQKMRDTDDTSDSVPTQHERPSRHHTLSSEGSSWGRAAFSDAQVRCHTRCCRSANSAATAGAASVSAWDSSIDFASQDKNAQACRSR